MYAVSVLISYIIPSNIMFIKQITTFSRLLAPQEQKDMEINGFQMVLLSLMQFQTEHSFREALT